MDSNCEEGPHRLLVLTHESHVLFRGNNDTVLLNLPSVHIPADDMFCGVHSSYFGIHIPDICDDPVQGLLGVPFQANMPTLETPYTVVDDESSTPALSSADGRVGLSADEIEVFRKSIQVLTEKMLTWAYLSKKYGVNFNDSEFQVPTVCATSQVVCSSLRFGFGEQVNLEPLVSLSVEVTGT